MENKAIIFFPFNRTIFSCANCWLSDLFSFGSTEGNSVSNNEETVHIMPNIFNWLVSNLQVFPYILLVPCLRNITECNFSIILSLQFYELQTFVKILVSFR